MQVPPELGNGTANAGISLARLLWFLTPRQAVTLVASLLLERRIILVARDADTVSAAVHAANALLYPFRWQHIYLPLLPLALKVRGGWVGGLHGWLAGWQCESTVQSPALYLSPSPILPRLCSSSQINPPRSLPACRTTWLPQCRTLWASRQSACPCCGAWR